MSLLQFAIRVCTVRALQASLPASVAVLDSPQEPITLLDEDPLHPIVAVYTGATVTKYDGRNFLGGTTGLTVAIQFLLPETFAFDVGEDEITIDTRRQGAETALDVLWRKASLALNGSTEPWAALWREFVTMIAGIELNSFLIERNGVRVTAREAAIRCEPIHEPVPGGDPSLAWETLLTRMRADQKADGLSYLADWIEAEIRGGENMTQGERDAAYIGLSRYVAQTVAVIQKVQDVNNQPGPADIEEPVPPAPGDGG